MSAEALPVLNAAGPARPRRLLLWAALAATLVASAWVLTDGDGEAQAGPPPPTRREGAPRQVSAPLALASAEAPLVVPQRALRLRPQHDLFAAVLLAPPPPAAPMVAAAPPPPPPPITLPYTFGGRLLTEGGPSVLLNEGAQTHVLALGNTLGNFRFEQDAGAQIVFNHVPNGERLVLPVPH